MYCPRCGVSVNEDVKLCPLCKYQLPEIGKYNLDYKYPEVENTHETNKTKTKEYIMRSIIIVLISSMFFLISQDFRYDKYLTWSNYTTISILSTIFYVLCLFGVFKKFVKTIIVLAITTSILILFLDSFTDKMNWSLFVGVPIVFITFLFLYFVHKTAVSKNIFLTRKILFYGLLIDIYLISMEIIIDLYLLKQLHINWSLQVFVAGIIPLIAIGFIPKKRSDQFVDSVLKKSHM